MRLGWVCANREILQKYILVKQGADLQSSTISQREVALFMQTYSINNHIQKIKKVYKRRRDVMLNAIAEYFPKEVKCTHPMGGLFTWVEVRDDMDAAVILKEALKKESGICSGRLILP